jgi:hypothetical protein
MPEATRERIPISHDQADYDDRHERSQNTR